MMNASSTANACEAISDSAMTVSCSAISTRRTIQPDLTPTSTDRISAALITRAYTPSRRIPICSAATQGTISQIEGAYDKPPSITICSPAAPGSG
jgi:hypothetical protein